MKDIDYIIERIKNIYRYYYDDVIIHYNEYKHTYRLMITLVGVKNTRKEFEIDKNIKSIAETINYICKELED